jgi:exopolysaccharide production protein ExoQ
MTQSLSMDDALIGRPALPPLARRANIALDWPLLIFAAFVSATVLFSSQLGSLTVVCHAMATLMLVASQPRPVLAALGRGWLLLIFMGWIFLSTIWSQYPGTTLYYGAEAALTMLIGLQLGRRSAQDEALIGLFLGWSLYTLSSLAFGHSVKWGSHGGSAFSGLSAVKNYAGDTAVLGFIFALHAMRWGLARGRLMLTAYAMVVALADLAIIAMAQSSGAILGVGEAIAVFLALSLFAILPLTMRTSILLVTVIVAVILFLTRDIWLVPLRNEVLSFFGKDPTLTGRTYLWIRAEDVIQSHRWLGVGYNAFWVQGNLDAEGLWRSEGIISRAGFNFHNSLIELRIHLGLIGVVMAGAILLIYSARLIKGFTLTPDLTKLTWITLLFYEFGRMSFEAIGIVPFSYATMILVGAMAHGGYESRRPDRT